MRYLGRVFENLEPQEFPELSVVAKVAQSSYQKMTSLFLKTMQRPHLRQVSYTTMFFFSPPQRLPIFLIAFIPVAIIMIQQSPTREVVSL